MSTSLVRRVIAGFITLSLVTHLFLLNLQGYGKLGQLYESHSPVVTTIFYIAIYLIELGNEAPEPALAAFGVDQFDKEDAEEKTFRYRHFKTVGNPVSKFSQVIVASMRKLNLQVPFNGEGLYDVERKEGKNNGARRILHTSGFKYLGRASIITLTNVYKGEPTNPWQLCTITQVDEVNYMCSMILTSVMTITSKNKKRSLVPPDLIDGHLDRYFLLLAALAALNLVLFVTCAKRCINEFSGHRMSKMKATIKSKVLNVAQLTSNALVLFHQCSAMYRGATIEKHL
ncbi:hypothetical protein V6N13_138124 [Hibiscus sabdariffa]